VTQPIQPNALGSVVPVFGGGGGGGGILAGDVTGPIAANTVVAIQGTAVNAAAPNVGDVLEFDGAEWVPTPGGGGGTLQDAYDAGNTIAVVAADGSVTLSNATDATDVLTIDRTFAGAGVGVVVTMGANTTGIGIQSTHLGDLASGPAHLFEYAGGTAGGEAITAQFLSDAENSDTVSIRWAPDNPAVGGNALSVFGTTNALAANPLVIVGNASVVGEFVQFDHTIFEVSRTTAATYTIGAVVQPTLNTAGVSFSIAAGAGNGSGDGGDVTINAGADGGTGTDGVINIGVTTASQINLTANAHVEPSGRIRAGDGTVALPGLTFASGTSLGFRFVNASRFDAVASGGDLVRFTTTFVETRVNLRVNDNLTHLGANVGFYGVAPTPQSATYTITNVTPDRAYDADSTTLDEIADTLGTLIADLQLTGLIG
jgi:hypothetical protein